MKLSIGERLVLAALLPQRGDYLTMVVVKELREKVLIPTAECEAIGLVVAGDRVTWDTTKAKVKDIDFSPGERVVVIEELKKLNTTKTLTLEQMSLYEAFGLGAGDEHKEE